MGIHDGHRSRMKARLQQHGMDNFASHEVLELLLFYAIPRGDVNPLAHSLMDRFGSLSGVFDAPIEELMTVDGIGPNTALLIKMIPEFGRRYLIDRNCSDNIVDSSHKAGEYLAPHFFGRTDELVYMLCLDSKLKVLDCELIFEGSVNSSSISMRKLAETVLAFGAVNVIIAHNHPSGIALPSNADRSTTQKIVTALKGIDVTLADHLIFAGDDWVSMLDSGLLSSL